MTILLEYFDSIRYHIRNFRLKLISLRLKYSNEIEWRFIWVKPEYHKIAIFIGSIANGKGQMTISIADRPVVHRSDTHIPWLCVCYSWQMYPIHNNNNNLVPLASVNQQQLVHRNIDCMLWSLSKRNPMLNMLIHFNRRSISEQNEIIFWSLFLWQ